VSYLVGRLRGAAAGPLKKIVPRFIPPPEPPTQGAGEVCPGAGRRAGSVFWLEIPGGRPIAITVRVSAFVCMLFLSVPAAWAVSPDYENMGIVLAENRRSLMFMDVCVVNLRGPSSEEDPKGMRAELEGIYRKAIEHDFYGNLWYLQGNYSRVYQEVRLSQKYLQDLHRRILENYIDETTVLLEASAPIIVLTRDATARKLLELGFRDIEGTRQTYLRGSYTAPTLFANQINYYTDGILRIRRARRFAILALLEAKVPIPEKAKYQLVTLDDVKNLMEQDEKQSKFVEILNLLINMTGRNLVPKIVTSDIQGKTISLKLLEVHQDNYGRMYSDRRSVFQKISLEMNTGEFTSLIRCREETQTTAILSRRPSPIQ